MMANRFDFYWVFGSSGPLYLKATFAITMSVVALFPLSPTAVFKITKYFSEKTPKEDKSLL